MKKNKLLFLSSLVFSLLPCTTSCGSYDLVVFNWGEYMDMDRLRQFEKERGVKVNYLTFDSNENLLAKLENTYFDICFPSDYAIEELVSKEMIQPLDYSKIPNFNLETSLVPSLKTALDTLKKPTLGKEGFDMLKYAIPYTWGEIGILYDRTKISDEEIKEDGWEALRNPLNKDGSKRKVVMYDSARDIFSVALIANGKDIVDITSNDIDIAKDWLSEQKKRIGNNLAYKTEEILDDMPNLKYDICFTYIGDAIYSMTSVEDDNGEIDYDRFGFYIPPMKAGGKTRTNIYVDAISLAKNSTHTELAYDFINYMQEHDVAYDNSLYNGYTSPINTIYEEITSENSEYEEGEGSFYPIASTYQIKASDNDKFYRYDQKLKTSLEEAWIEVKIS